MILPGRNIALSLALLASAAAGGEGRKPPYVSGRTLLDGEAVDVVLASAQAPEAKALVVQEKEDVFGCCSGDVPRPSSSMMEEGECAELVPALIGEAPQYSTEQALAVLDDASAAWAGGSGEWTQMSLGRRARAIERFAEEFLPMRERVVETLMWEIGKNRPDAEAEFDRTLAFIGQVLAAVRDADADEYSGRWRLIGSTHAFVRRTAIGIILCLGPYNYPLNETYATLIPALLMGNIVVMKVPTVGGLVHMHAMEAFAKALPAGAIHFVSGTGRATMPPMMETGKIDGLAFIGGARAADDLISRHPSPHRLTVFLQLEGKNMGIFLEDLFGTDGPMPGHLLDHAIGQAVTGALSFNGQRCTALKLMFVPEGKGEEVARKIADQVEQLTVGLPWQTFGPDGAYSQITPLPNRKRIEYMQSLIEDATAKGARIVNANGGDVVGGGGSTLMNPAVLFPITPDMDLYHEEQFGPIVAVAEYGDLDTVLAYARDGWNGQQASIFTAAGGDGDAATLIDRFSSVFGRINLNAQCGRSPDSLPFSGRRSSAMGVMSITDALREFSVPTVIAYKENGIQNNVVRDIQKGSSFMEDM